MVSYHKHIHSHTHTYSEGIRPPPEITTVPYSSVVNTLNTGDLVLFSGATSSGAIIKFFDNSQFSHVGLVSWECNNYATVGDQ